jgi:signal peptidase I
MGGEHMKFVIDRFEEGVAVCENIETRELINISVKFIPCGAKPGDVMEMRGGRLYLDNPATLARYKIIAEKFSRLKKKNGSR